MNLLKYPQSLSEGKEKRTWHISQVAQAHYESPEQRKLSYLAK